MSRRRFSFDQCGPALLVVGALAVSVWVFTLSKSSDRHPSGALDTTVAHIHALGVNPADDSLFAATHSGLFRFDDQGVATRVSDNHQDMMGFTVVGPDHFLASGHPDMAGPLAGQPALLGLVESTDAGQSWANVSLSGEADFHGLSVVNGTVHGWDSTSRAFMVSADQLSWERRSTIDLFDFVVDRADESRVVGAAPQGVVQSTDGGRTWSPPTGPQLVGVTSASDGSLRGVDARGSIWSSEDGWAWTEVGRIDGEPNAVLASGDWLWIATQIDDLTTTIQRSDDDGDSWVVVYQGRSALPS